MQVCGLLRSLARLDTHPWASLSPHAPPLVAHAAHVQPWEDSPAPHTAVERRLLKAIMQRPHMKLEVRMGHMGCMGRLLHGMPHGMQLWNAVPVMYAQHVAAGRCLHLQNTSLCGS